MDTLAIFGSTGSIGKTSLNIYKKNKKKFNLLYLSAHNNYYKLKILEKKFNPKKIILTNKKLNKSIFSNDKKIILEKNLFDKNKKKIDYVISGVSGYEAIEFNFKLLKIAKNLLIANKETIICGGHIFLKEAKKYGCNLIPIDSEHYCINYFFENFQKININEIEKIYLVASGGPLLNSKIKYNEKLKKVLNHPNWKMGKKITIDSSNLANKILELFEAKILFNIPGEKLEILIEPTSSTHAIIKLNNGLYFPIMHKPEMEIPISNSLKIHSKKKLNIKNLKISFAKPDSGKFPIVNLGYKILKEYGYVAMIFFTVINERLAKMYLKNDIKYGDIPFFLLKSLKNKTLTKHLKKSTNTLSSILKLIKIAQKLKIT